MEPSKVDVLHTVHKYEALLIYCNNDSMFMYTASASVPWALPAGVSHPKQPNQTTRKIIRVIMMMALLHERKVAVA